jgi:ABC-type multidrug transport system fused ATPase/permease subunit
MAAAEGKTCLMIAHRLSTVVSADNILVMESGKIIENGNHSELLVLNGFYSKLWEEQINEVQEDEEEENEQTEQKEK